MFYSANNSPIRDAFDEKQNRVTEHQNQENQPEEGKSALLTVSA